MEDSNKIIPPHLNAEVYRTDTTGAGNISYLDYLRFHPGINIIYLPTLLLTLTMTVTECEIKILLYRRNYTFREFRINRTVLEWGGKYL